MAAQVSIGCNGAAQRFIRVTALLSQSGFAAHDAITEGVQFATRTDSEAATFVSVFQRAYLPDYLDMDLQGSLLMARDLAARFEGDVLEVQKDFERLVKFCMSAKDLDLPKPQCGALAARVAGRGRAVMEDAGATDKTEKTGISGAFISAFNFLRSPRGPELATFQALQVAEELVVSGVDGVENFKKAYRYALSKKGLGVPRQEAIVFARNLGKQTPAAEPKVYASEVKRKLNARSQSARERSAGRAPASVGQ